MKEINKIKKLALFATIIEFATLFPSIALTRDYYDEGITVTYGGYDFEPTSVDINLPPGTDIYRFGLIEPYSTTEPIRAHIDYVGGYVSVDGLIVRGLKPNSYACKFVKLGGRSGEAYICIPNFKIWYSNNKKEATHFRNKETTYISQKTDQNRMLRHLRMRLDATDKEVVSYLQPKTYTLGDMREEK